MSEKTKKLLLVAAFISIFVIGIFAGKFIAWLEGPDKRLIYEAHLNGALKTAEKYGLEYVYLKDLANFEWERVCIIEPYMTSARAEQKTGIKYANLALHDEAWELLFIDKNKKLIPLKIDGYNVVSFGFDIKGAGYCADKGNAKLVFYTEKKFGMRVAALVQQ